MGGLEYIVRNLIAGLNEIKTDCEFLVWRNSKVEPIISIADTPNPSKKRFIDIPLDVEPQFGSNYSKWLLERFSETPPDIMYYPFSTLFPFDLPYFKLLNVADIQHEYFPEFYDKDELKKRKERYKPSCESADLILAVSKFTKDSLIKKFQIDPQKIKIFYIPCRVPSSCLTLNYKQSGNQQTSFFDRYIFYPANTWRHKNHINLLKSFDIMKDKWNYSGGLILSGTPKEEEHKIQEYIQSSKHRNCIVRLSFIPRDEFWKIFLNAECLVFPSLFEGFGIPLAEAMMLGIPIAASNIASISEITDGAALLFEPNNPEDIADKTMSIINNRNLRDAFINKGGEIAVRYDYIECAKSFMSIINQVLC